MRAVAAGDELVLRSLFRIARPGCVLEIMVGIDAERDRGEIGRLGVPDLSTEYLQMLKAKYKAAGFDPVDCRWLGRSEWSKIETSWARRLNPNANRSVVFLLFKKN